MAADPSIFRMYDIRGVYPDELDEEGAYLIARAYARLRKQEKPGSLTIAVGRDMRDSSPSMTAEVIRGLREEGCNVVDIGLVSTPTFYFGVAHYKYDGGLMISASHNPAQYNGLKMVREQAKPVSGESGINEIAEMVATDDFPDQPATGQLETNEDVLQAQVEAALQHIDVDAIKEFKIVIDSANGMGALYCDALFDELPCEVIKMYWELDGSFPNHEADPLKEENLVDLQKRVVEEKADLGITTDGDGDRIFFVDNTGERIAPEIVRGLLAQLFLKEKPDHKKVAYDIRPGRITRDMIEAAGGEPVLTRVGHSLIKQVMIDEDIYFAGESSGHFFLQDENGAFERPLVMVVKLLELFSQQDGTVAELVAPLRKYHHSGEINSEVESVAKTLEAIKEKYSDGEINELDGVTVTYDEWWFNVRGSNTEPKIRLNLEATSDKLMQAKRDEVLKVIRG